MGRPGGARGRRIVGWGFVAVSLGFVAVLLVRQGGELPRLRADLDSFGWTLHPGWLAVALAVGTADLFLMGWLWVLLFRSLGGRVGAGEGIRVWMTTNLGRYVPGKIWQLSGLALYMRDRRGAGAAALTAAGLYQVAGARNRGRRSGNDARRAVPCRRGAGPDGRTARRALRPGPAAVDCGPDLERAGTSVRGIRSRQSAGAGRALGGRARTGWRLAAERTRAVVRMARIRRFGGSRAIDDGRHILRRLRSRLCCAVRSWRSRCPRRGDGRPAGCDSRRTCVDRGGGRGARAGCGQRRRNCWG